MSKRSKYIFLFLNKFVFPIPNAGNAQAATGGIGIIGNKGNDDEFGASGYGFNATSADCDDGFSFHIGIIPFYPSMSSPHCNPFPVYL